ncbi:MAG: hypothetical protein K9H16_12675 [Bacteroidales bacterium]|nr:hypothetical protein [Bacteroidales bacterium]
MQQNKNITVTLQNIAIAGFYLFTIGLILTGMWYFIDKLFQPPGVFFSFYIVLAILGGGMLGAWLWVLIKLPSGIARAFDPVRNKIAGRQITTAHEFAREIGAFIVKYFSFYRFDVLAVKISIKNQQAIVFPNHFEALLPKEKDYVSLSRQGEEIIKLGKIAISQTKCHGYLIPIWFGKEWLGYICVYSETALSRINLNFLKEFEELYVDDQLMHVLYFERMKQNRQSDVNDVS